MRYECILLAVSDLERAREFYQDVLGLKVKRDFGANVMLEGGVALQALASWATLINKGAGEIAFGNHACELYFETEEIEAFARDLERRGGVEFLHPLREHSWGQRALRFYDPDHHVIEVGEAMPAVVSRFLRGGLSPAETAARMDVPLPYVKDCMARAGGGSP